MAFNISIRKFPSYFRNKIKGEEARSNVAAMTNLRCSSIQDQHSSSIRDQHSSSIRDQHNSSIEKYTAETSAKSVDDAHCRVVNVINVKSEELEETAEGGGDSTPQIPSTVSSNNEHSPPLVTLQPRVIPESSYDPLWRIKSSLPSG